MHIGVIGATGTIGSRIVTEALGRDHRVTAFSRDASAITDRRGNLDWASIDVLDPASVAAALPPGLDVLISGFQPGNASLDFHDTVRRSIADPGVYAQAARSLLAALDGRPRVRLIMIGGAGSLELAPGVVRADHDELLHAALDELGLPREYAAAVRGHREALDMLRTSNRLWTYFSPAEQIGPGERTGRFRLGGDQPVLDADGQSRISAEDAAVALVDEAELPRHVQRRFTVGY
ncbi:NAD(P)-dependent oxidoreductase [Kitasatospora griseola]|uniref:NAD(P)-dependent oxidoreductase n=1 Tax=Kitasatospora griseola TaxID=2064 RepID=UPI00380AC72F